MKDGFLKIACASAELFVAGCADNADKIVSSVEQAEALGARLVLFPELSVTSASCSDLLFSDALLSSAVAALESILIRTSSSDTIIIIGFPLVVNDKIYNCAAFCQKGKILGVVPKSILSAAEKRYFSAYSENESTEIKLCGQRTRFGTDIIFKCKDMPTLKVGIEIGTECFAPLSPATELCALGATLIVNPFAKPYLVGDSEYTKTVLACKSAQNICAYALSGASEGESTTDGIFGGEAYIFENGKLIAQRRALSRESRLTVSEIDLSLVSAERRKNSTFFCEAAENFNTVEFSLKPKATRLTRKISPSPFLPEEDSQIAERCATIINMQAEGLAKRLTAAYAKKAVIGISGGLDSCLALLVCARTMDILGRDRSDIIAVTMPCFGTTERTRTNAEILCEELGTQFKSIDIGKSVMRHFEDIGHDPIKTDVVFENAQARERTQVLMDISNMVGGLVVGTGDLSELVLGWATYNGDHMSMYGVNGGIPKTLVRRIVEFCADCALDEGKAELSRVLYDVLDTPVSPELLPADNDGNIAQKTEDLVGPYRLHDFYIFYMLRYGFAPDKLFRMAKHAFEGEYTDEELLHWLKNLIRRFFAQQFKRSCLPDGVKIGTVGVSPRGDLCMPSDAVCTEWMRIVNEIKI